MVTQLISAQVGQYLESLVPERPAEMQAMETHARRTGFPIVGPAAGYFCYQIARLTGARHVFELGSGFGYSTAWFARAVQENGGGTVHHVVWDQQLSDEAREHLGALGFGQIIRYHVAEAVQTLGETPGPFDLIFNDICKECYPDSLPVIRDKLRPGGVLLVDNMLWGGRVLDEGDRSSTTEGIREFTRRVVRDPGWISMVVPIRDGLLLAYKQGA
jgi:caffeoyl-CoA O-methyltransferase